MVRAVPKRLVAWRVIDPTSDRLRCPRGESSIANEDRRLLAWIGCAELAAASVAGATGMAHGGPRSYCELPSFGARVRELAWVLVLSLRLRDRRRVDGLPRPYRWRVGLAGGAGP